MFKEFNKNFGVITSLEEEQNKFVQRVIVFFDSFCGSFLNREEYDKLIETICIQFGKNPDDLTISLGTYTRLPELPIYLAKIF